jgi:hypothetical protein
MKSVTYSPTKYHYSIVLALLFSLIFSVSCVYASVGDAIGKVIAVRGIVEAVDKNKKTRVLERRSEFFVGDTLTTKAKASIKLRFIDGTLTSLKPETTLKLTNYHYKSGDKANNRNISELIQGGLKSMTGRLSKNNPDAYKIETPVATIGIRGTVFEASYNPKTETLNGAVYVGEIFVNAIGGDKMTISAGNVNRAFIVTGNDPIKLMSLKQLRLVNSPCGPQGGDE